jgi:hypothetical protein
MRGTETRVLFLLFVISPPAAIPPAFVYPWIASGPFAESKA